MTPEAFSLPIQLNEVTSALRHRSRVQDRSVLHSLTATNDVGCSPGMSLALVDTPPV